MTAVVEKREWLEQLLQAGAATGQETELQPWMQRRREQAIADLQQLPIPTRKSEGWRYTLLDGLFGATFAPSSQAFEALQAEDIDDWLLADTRAYRLVFANGHMVPALKSFAELPEGVTIGSLRQVLQQQPEMLSVWFGQTANHSQDVFTALNTALMNDGLFVHLKRDTVLDRPLEVMHLNLSLEQAALIQPCSLLVLEQGASAQVIERFSSSGDSVYFHNGVTEILLEEQAALTHVCLQEESREAFHLHRRFLSQAAQSRYSHTAIALGGKWARTELQARFTGQQAECHSRGLYLTGDGQLTDQRLEVQHNTPGNASQHHYKGIVYGAGRAVFDGRIVVSQDAQKTDAHLSNHNLLLSREGEVDTKPQLEIYADDVKCSHGTTVGQLEPEQLFYLRSRGINRADAMKMLCHGFASEVFEAIELDVVRDYLERRLAAVIDTAIVP
ncbi:MAG: Fe-S cluster assembly protein SufD [Gammaproteobacteria bacterium]